MKRVTIPIPGRPYEALIGSGLLKAAGEHIAAIAPAGARFFVVTNPVVRGKWGSALERSLKDAKLKAEWLEIPDGERMKTMGTIENLAGRMLKAGADRGVAVIGFGGGVVGDLAGFLASVFMRGVPVIQVPTTFLAQVDASIGGKTGVNLSAGKNLLGTFHQPLAVLIDPAVLATLPDREFRAGLFESLKCGVISRAEIFEYMEKERDRILQREAAALEWLIAETVEVKARVVGEDEREAGLRRILNFGHTIGHALEAETKYKQYLHGEAVAWGMVAATMLSVAMQKTPPPTAQRIIAAVLAYSPLPKVNVRAKSVVKRLAMDKKSRNGVPHFILPVEIGKVEISNEVPPDMVIHALDEVRYLSKWNSGE
ncbi:MAG: 3-dehydroquinate synthase [Candidatus Koribacter versatilis]|uniref:3-dehydroquinate synthase n=1 Tax=Candidatus Korobacter versatilis TaxID=658062 RepID=A0A932A8S8_9BACT|nr:3-dehydroquinate synthase [Candidatus Koribacter versatilis]